MLGSDQVGQGEEDVQLCRVLAQSPVARFAVSEEVLKGAPGNGFRGKDIRTRKSF